MRGERAIWGPGTRADVLFEFCCFVRGGLGEFGIVTVHLSGAFVDSIIIKIIQLDLYDSIMIILRRCRS